LPAEGNRLVRDRLRTVGGWQRRQERRGRVHRHGRQEVGREGRRQAKRQVGDQSREGVRQHERKVGVLTTAPLVRADTGGTFTDLVAVVDGRLRVLKIPSTPRDPAEAVRQGLRVLGGATRLHYGSTVATNALLERRGAPIVLLTTAGFEDVLEIGRQVRS